LAAGLVVGPGFLVKTDNYDLRLNRLPRLKTADLFSYNVDKAKQLLKEAGYPNGFKTSILLPNTTAPGGISYVDYYSVIKDYWAKIGIELSLDLRDSNTVTTILANNAVEAMTPLTTAPAASFVSTAFLQSASGRNNPSMINDPIINAAMIDIRSLVLTDLFFR